MKEEEKKKKNSSRLPGFPVSAVLAGGRDLGSKLKKQMFKMPLRLPSRMARDVLTILMNV